MHLLHGSLYNTMLMQFPLRLRQDNIFFMFLWLLVAAPAGQQACWLTGTS